MAGNLNGNIKAVIFDLDGTLINAYKAVYESINFAMEKTGYPRVSALTIRRSVGWGDRHLIEKFVGKKNLEPVLAIYRRHHRLSLKHGTTLLPGALKILRELKKHNYKLAVA